jgi:MoxR-like ATPase
MNRPEATQIIEEIQNVVTEAVITDDEFLRTILTGVLAGGHVLIQDVPGTGKTLTARSLASALGLSFNRIQFTPDLLPGDITGSHIYNENTGEFEFNSGPIFANVVLADEINRAPPKTQAALLEAMGEKQVTTDDETRQLPEPFFVIATQNPIEQEGTFPLPEAQRDRFMIKTEMGYPTRDGELELINRRADRTTSAPNVDRAVADLSVTALRDVVEHMTVADELCEYIVDIGRATREDSRVAVGVSPRGIQRLFEAARARAVIDGREYLVPDDVRAVVHPVFDHRIVLTSEASISGHSKAQIVTDACSSVAVPAMPKQ